MTKPVRSEGLKNREDISAGAGVAPHSALLAPGGVVYSATKFAVRALSEGLRQEAGKTIRTTLISPGAVESELQFGSSDEESKKFLHEFYKQAIPADAIARAVLFAIEQPGDVDINEIVVRPTQEEF